MSALDQAGVKIGPVMEIEDREAAREAVIRGLGIGVVSDAEFASHERLETLRVSNARTHIYAYVG